MTHNNEDVGFMLKSVLGNLKTAMNLELTEIQFENQANVSTKDYNANCKTRFVNCDYDLSICVRIDENNRMETRVAILQMSESNTGKMILELAVNDATPAVAKDVVISAIQTTLTRTARTMQSIED